MKLDYPNGATPIDSNELKDIIPDHIFTQKELNEWEAANILHSIIWLKTQKITNNSLLEQKFILKLHEKMFDKTWEWAGKFRRSEKNIGVEAYQIALQLNQLMSDVKYWMENHIYSIDDIAMKLHHKIVFIHPFANGNGRFSRAYSDLFLKINNTPPFTWGGKNNLGNANKEREFYIKALRLADNHDFSSLKEFVRS